MDVHKASRALARNQLREKTSGISQSACIRNCTRGLPKDWPGKAQRTVWLTVWIVARDVYICPSQQFWRKSRRTTSQAGNVEFQQHMTWIRTVAWQMGMPSWPLRRTGRHLSSWRATKDPGRCERPYAGGCDHLLEARVHDREVINCQQTLSKERTITNVSYRKAVAAARQAASFEFCQHRLCGLNWRGGRWEWRRACGAERERHLPSGRARDRMVVEDAVTSIRHRCTTARSSNLCRSRSRRKTSSASMYSGKMLQRDTAGVLCTERKTAPLEKNGSRSGFVTTLQGDVTLRHPQPATNVPMNCSLAPNVVSS